jgi:hypothetical protein
MLATAFFAVGLWAMMLTWDLLHSPDPKTRVLLLVVPWLVPASIGGVIGALLGSSVEGFMSGLVIGFLLFALGMFVVELVY